MKKGSIENWIYVAVAVGHLLSCSWQLKSVPKKWYEKDRKEVWKKFKHFSEDIRCCQKKVHPPRNIFKSVLKRRVKKQKGLKGGPKKCTKESCNILKYSKWWQWKFIPIKKYPKECQKRFPKKTNKEMLKKSPKKVLKRVPKKGFQKKVQEKVEKKDLKKCK